MTWTNHLGNKLPVESLYSEPPLLDQLRLHEVRLHQDGPRISLRLDLNEFPDRPPKKWVAGKFNRIQLTLVLVDIDSFRMDGWDLNNIGDLSLKDCDAGVCLQFDGPTLQIDCTARFLEVEKISGYYDSEATTTTP